MNNIKHSIRSDVKSRAGSPAAFDPLLVSAPAGQWQGVQGSGNSRCWLGIKYAQAQRWQAPIPVPNDDHIVQANTPGPGAVQFKYDAAWRNQPEIQGSEDCLYLNVHRPNTEQKDLPVYVWIHGGANLLGDASRYNLDRLAETANIVAVSIQYRLNVFGYFYHPAIADNRESLAASGNYGLLDQIQALKWVQQNIAAFGGNPQNVCIAGQSAGAHNVTALLVCPEAKGLFHKAMIQSGAMLSESKTKAAEKSQRLTDRLLSSNSEQQASLSGQRLAGHSGKEIARLLSDIPAEKLLQAWAGGEGKTAVPPGCVIEDGQLIPSELMSCIRQGCYNKVPVLAGATLDEAGSLACLLPPLYDGMPNYSQLPDDIMQNQAVNNPLNSEAARTEWFKTREYGSAFWRNKMIDELLKAAAGQHPQVYSYSFNWGRTHARQHLAGEIQGAAHALDVGFFHGTVLANDDTASKNLTEAVFSGVSASAINGRHALSKNMVNIIASFCYHSTPTLISGPSWPAWQTDAPLVMQLDANEDEAAFQLKEHKINAAGLRDQLANETPEIQQHVTRVLDAMQPYWRE